MKRCGGQGWVSHLTLILSLAIPILILLSGPTLRAQEIIDRKSGQVFLSVTDLTVQAGPVSLEVRRSLETGKGPPGLLGTRWRLNWESRLIQAGPLVLIEEMTGAASFTQDGARGEYKSAVGDRLVFDKTGRATRTKLDGTKETFDAQGRLVERDYRNGNRAIVYYGPGGRLARIEGPRGSALRFAIDKAGRVIQIEASTTATVRYVYQSGELAEVQRPPAPPTRYSYFTDGRLSRIENPQYGAVQFAYDFKGRVMSRWWADGSKERYEYDDKANRLRYTDAVGAVTTIQWSQDRRREEVTDPLGRKSVLEYDLLGRPLSVTGPSGATSRLTYDSLGRTTEVTNPLGQATKLEYLGESSLVQAITQPGGDRQVFEYDSGRNLTTVRVGREVIAAFTYNPDGSPATASGRGTAKRAFTYHPDGRLKSIANAFGETTQFEYDRRGNPIREINPLGGTTIRDYDAQDRVVSRTDPAGGAARYEHDAKGRLSRLIDPSGAVTRFEYDARGRLVAETGPTGLVTKYEYDAAGRGVKVIGPGNRITTRRYDTLGNLTGLTDPLGRTTQFDYDQLGRLARERKPTSLEMTYRYDGLGNLLGIEDNTGTRSEFQRDASGQLTSIVDPVGAASRYQYDPLGNIVSVTDPAGHLTRYTYAQIGTLAGVRLPSGDETRYDYDAAGRLVGLRRPSGGVTRVGYDAMGNITAMSDPLGNKRQRNYDLSGRLISATDAAGRTTRYLYDRSSRLTEKQLPDGRKVTYEYDALGNRLKADDGTFPVLYHYNQMSRLVGVEYPAIKKSVRYAYDASGLKTKLIDTEGREVRYEYNALKQVSAIVLPDGKRIALAYDLKDRLSSIRYPNGVIGQWEYDGAGRTVKIGYQDRDGRAVAGFSYRYDSTGNPVERQDSEGRTARFQYDSAGQLVEEVGPGGTTRYRYLPGGNRSTVEEHGAVTQYRYDADDRLIQAGAEQFTYDKNGKLIGRKGSGGSIAYEYDPEERLVKVVGREGGTTTFGYAPTSERVWKKDQQGLTYFLYDGFDLIQELEEGGNIKATYVHGPGIDRPLVMIRNGKTYYYHADRLGSITHLTDDQGQIVASYDYDAFGKITDRQGSVANPFTLTGREFDVSTGLYYYRARYYDATLGRFLTKDPAPPRMDKPLEVNPYLYVRNSPLRFVDPLGLLTPGENLWYTEGDIRYYRSMLENPEAVYAGSSRAEIEEGLARAEARAAELRAQGVQPEPIGEPPPSLEPPAGGGRPRTPTIKTQLPEAPAAPEVSSPGGRGGPTQAVPRGGPSAPEAPVAPEGPFGVKPETLGRVVVGAAAALQLASCLDLGKSLAQCSIEVGIGTAVGLAIAQAAAAAGLSVPLLLAAGGYGWVQVASEGSQQVKDFLDRRRAQQAREAQQQENLKNKDAIIGQLQADIDSKLSALRGQIAGAVAGAKGAAQSAVNAATAAANLLTTLKGYGPQIAQASAACKEVEALMSEIQAAASNAALYAGEADALFTSSQSLVDECQAKDDVATAQKANDAAKKLASAAASNYKNAQKAIDKLNGIRAQSESARLALNSAAGVLAKIQAEVASAGSFAATASSEFLRAQQLSNDLEKAKPAMLDEVKRLRWAFPADAPEVDALLTPLINRLTAGEAAPDAKPLKDSTDAAGQAQGIGEQAQAILDGLNGLTLCDQVSPPSIDEAAQALASLGMGGMSEGFSGKAAACLAKLGAPQAPATATGRDKPPGDPTLTSFVVSCSPSQIKVSKSSSCKATGEYSTQPGVYVDLTVLAAWGPGPTIIGDWPGSWFAKASYGGKSATATVTVVADDQGPPPGIPGAGQQPFGGGIPPTPGTSGATGGGQPVQQPGPQPPPTGPGEAPPSYPGYPCGSPGYPPCPPGYYPPGPYGGESPVQVPWQGLVPPPGSSGTSPPSGGGPCPPGCHVRPDGGGCDCPSQPCKP